METLWQDIRCSLRLVRRNSGFAAVVVLVLAIGIGSNTAVFSVVNAVMLRPLPYKDSHQIVTIWERDQDLFRPRWNFRFLCEHNRVFESLAGYCRRRFYVAGIEQPHEIHGTEVTSNLFSLLGVQPLLGRGFLPEDESAESPRVVVLSHTFWKDHLGGSPDAIGKSISLASGRPSAKGGIVMDRESYTIVGVMPPGFGFPFGRSAPLWRPIVFTGAVAGGPRIPILPLARLKKGVTLKRANADLAVLADRLRQMDPKANSERGSFGVERLLDGVVKGHRRLPLLLLGAAGFVLLIACGNVANLFLARATVRQREIAVRMALGASRVRIMCQMLTESLLLSVAAGMLGLLLTCGMVKGVVRLCSSPIPRLQETSVDMLVLGFTLGVSVLTGLLFGVMPAWRASDIGLSKTLKEGRGRTTGGSGWRRLHSGLVVSQLALSMILLVGAALLVRSVIALERVDLGFQPQNVLAMSIWLPQAKYSNTANSSAFFQSLLDRLRALPGVHSAAAVPYARDVTSAFDMTGAYDGRFSVSGQADPEQSHSAKWVSVTPDFLETMGIKLLRGRAFTERDEGCIVIDEALAQRCFNDCDPIGQRLITDGAFDGILEQTVVGVAETMRDFATPESVNGIVYTRGDKYSGTATIVVRTDGDSMRLAPAIRVQVAELEKDRVIRQVEPLVVTLSQMLAPRRFVMVLLSLFAGIALTLAVVGVYSLLQYSAMQQTRDIGIRMALGARRTNILHIVVGHGLKLTLVGMVIGLAGAMALTRFLSSLLYEVTPTDSLTLMCVSLILAVIALLASYIPACRAAKIDPMVALRCE